MPDNKNRGGSWDTASMIWHAKSLQRVAKELRRDRSKSIESDLLLFSGKFLAEPVLLSLAIEIALKAWQCRERNEAPKPSHDLLKLFDGLESSTQEILEAKMRKRSPHSVWAEEPSMQNLNSDQQDMLGAKTHPLRDVLCSHRDEHTHWRYLYEDPVAQFETAEIDRALTVIIHADHAPIMPPFMSRVCWGYGPVWTGLQTPVGSGRRGSYGAARCWSRAASAR